MIAPISEYLWVLQNSSLQLLMYLVPSFCEILCHGILLNLIKNTSSFIFKLTSITTMIYDIITFLFSKKHDDDMTLLQFILLINYSFHTLR